MSRHPTTCAPLDASALVPVELAISRDSAAAANHAIVLSLGLGVLAETVVVRLRAMRSSATVVWEKGDHGQPHRTSAAFDRARAYLNGGDARRVGLSKDRPFPVIARDW